MVHTFQWKQSGMLLVDVTSKDGNVELTTPIGVKEVEPAVFSFVVEWLMSIEEGTSSPSTGRVTIHRYSSIVNSGCSHSSRRWQSCMTQLVEWRMENTDQLLHELHQEVIISKDLPKLMISLGLESWDPN